MSITVIMVLMGLLLPTLSSVREVARRVACSSNVRQFGLGISIYAQDHREMIPPSYFMSLKENDPANKPELMMTARLDDDNERWDGLGVLFKQGYTPAAGIYYCPSHMGSNPYSAFQSAWLSNNGLIMANYHYRGVNPAGNSNRITAFAPSATMVSDGLASESDYNHRIGNNALRADLGVQWVADYNRNIVNTLPKDSSSDKSFMVKWAWVEIDRAVSTYNSQTGEGPPPP